MRNNIYKMVSVILAGGLGTRMGSTGVQIPKVYLPVGLEPVINRPVSRSLEIGEIERTFILTRKKHPDLPNVDLKQWAETWKSLWYGDKDQRIQITYEEELRLSQINGKVSINGAIIALAKIASKFSNEKYAPSHILIMAGDNFIDSDISPLVHASHESPESVIVASRTITNRALAQNRFGVIELNQRGGSSIPVIGYKEKPDDPQSSDISIGLYIFPLKQLMRVQDYLKHILGSRQYDLQDQKTRVGAPGYFLEWLISNHTTVRAVPFEDGTWVDVGTPASFMTAIVQLSKKLIERPQSAQDLDVLESTKDLSDKFYFLCHRAKISRSKQNNTISLYFQGNDSIATLNKQAADGTQVLDVHQIISMNKNKNKNFWSTLIGSKPGNFKDKHNGPRQLESPLLISGGIFLIDRGGDQAYQRGRAIIPFLMRDLGAPVDAGRLTTAAGRMDKLDLADVCVSEHAEEMIFLGSLGVNNFSSVRILICTPPQWRKLARETILSRLAIKGNLVPMIDSSQIELERKKGVALITEDVETVTLTPPSKHNWTVKIYYRESSKDKWQLRHEYKNFILIPDQKSATLEFRLLWLSAITTNTGKNPSFDISSSSLGRLLGIVDGDGHSRTALMVKAHELVDYIDRTKEQPINEILFMSDDSERPVLNAIAVTNGNNGRFTGLGRDLSLAPLTTSVSFFAELLKHPLSSADGS